MVVYYMHTWLSLRTEDVIRYSGARVPKSIKLAFGYWKPRPFRKIGSCSLCGNEAFVKCLSLKLTCQLLLSLCRSCFENHIVENSWVLYPYHAWKTLSSSRCSCPLNLAVFTMPPCLLWCSMCLWCRGGIVNNWDCTLHSSLFSAFWRIVELCNSLNLL